MVTHWFLFQCIWVLEYSLRCRFRIGVDTHGPQSWIRQTIISNTEQDGGEISISAFGSDAFISCFVRQSTKDWLLFPASFANNTPSLPTALFPELYHFYRNLFPWLATHLRCNISHVLRIIASGYVRNGIYGNEKIGSLLSSQQRILKCRRDVAAQVLLISGIS